MANLDTTPVPVAGGVSASDSTVPASGGGDTAPVGPNLFLYVSNGDAAPHTATVVTPGTVAGLAVSDSQLVVAAGEVGLLPLPRLFAGANNRAQVTYDAVTNVRVAVFELKH